MTIRTWATISAIWALSYAVFLVVQTIWWFWPSEISHRITMVVGSILVIAWCSLYFTLKE